jgi:hypothetical protein
MPSPVRTYQAEMHRNLGFFATWLPGDPVDIGDVGVLVDGRFRQLASLRELDIPYTEGMAGASQNVEYTSTGGTTIGGMAGANATGVARAQISIEFAAEGAFIFHASGMRVRRLQELTSLGARVLRAYERGQWQKEWLLIEALHIADCPTVIVSQDTSAGLVLTAKAETPLSAVSLADTSLGLEVSSSHGKLARIVAARDLRPLYSCIRVQASFFENPSLAPVRGPNGQENQFERAEITNLLDT